MTDSGKTVLTSFKLTTSSAAAVEKHLTDLTYQLDRKVHKVTLFQWLTDRFLEDADLQQQFREFLNGQKKPEA
ncbi:hypothetical protein [Azospirillum sp. A23]|uniref:hypothetical protein n=1 Tax=Azospirillum sp. A23 TaxID=3160608 RepID=UPI0036F294FA